MSWQKNMVGNREGLHDNVDGDPYLPQEVKESIGKMIDTFPEAPGTALHVETQGHIDPKFGGSATFKIETVIKAIKATAVVFAAIALLFLCSGPATAGPAKGDVIVGLGWAYNAPTSDLDVRTGGLVASAEVFLSDDFSLRADYFRVEVEKEITVPAPALVETYGGEVRTFLEESESKGFSIAASPRIGNLSFPFGLLGVSLDGDNRPQVGATAGAWLDFWATDWLGIGFGASYQYLRNTDLKEDFVDVRTALRFKF